MKKLLRLSSVLLVVLFLISSVFVGFSSTKSSTARSSASQKKIGMVISTLNNPFFVTMKTAAEKKAKQLGYKLIILDSQNDAARERSNVEDLVQQGISVLIINPTDSDAAATSVKVAINKKIPVISVDRAVNGAKVVCHIASDNVAGGKMAAEFILKKLNNKGRIVELQGIPGASATRERGKGFHSVVDGKPNVKIVASQAADFDRQKGLDVMQNIIQANPNFDAVFAHNDEMALGAITALKAANKKVIVVGFDGTPDALKAIKNGDMTATIAQQPDVMGSLAVENAVKLIKGQKIPQKISVSLKLITKDNVK